jgi:glutamate-1-semialdehyde 2,1-aminomutase
MDQVAPEGKIYQAGTLSGNPLAMAAGLATLRSLKRLNPYAHLESLGRRLAEGLKEAAEGFGEALTVNRVGSMLTPFFALGGVTDFASASRSDTRRYAAFFHGMLGRGIYLPPAQFEALFLSTSHTEQEVDRTLSAARDTLREMGR